MPSIHSSVSTSRAVRSQSTVGHAKIRVVLGVLRHLGQRGGFQPEIHFDRDRAAQRLDDFDQPQPARFSGQGLGFARGKEESVEIGVEAPLDAGPQHFHRHRPARAVDLDVSAMHLRDRGGGDSGTEARVDVAAKACPSAAATAASASLCGNGAILSCRLSRSRAIAVPTTSGRVARNWPSLT